MLWLHGADHMSFGGGSARPMPAVGPFRRHGTAAALEPAHRVVVARVTALWWQAQLLGGADAKTALRQLHQLHQLVGLAEVDRFTID